VIATYNRSQVLRYSIESVLLQSFSDWELIVVGDGCTEETEEVVNAFRDPRIRFHNLARRTGEQSGPHNFASTMCRADTIAYLSHDDHWLPDHLRLCYEALHARSADLVMGTAACIGRRASQPLRFDQLDIALLGAFADHRYAPSASMNVVAPASSLVVRRSALVRLGGWRLSRDLVVEPSQDLLFRAWRAGLRLYALNEVTLVVVSAGHRPGSYHDPSSEDARWIDANLVRPNASAELTALACETNEAFVARQPRPSRWRSTADAVLARVGVNPRMVTFARSGWSVGGSYVSRLRQLKGVPLPEIPLTAPEPRLRYEMVTRECHVELDETVHFAAGSGGARLLASGWSRPDAQGVWSDGRHAELMLDIGVQPLADAILEIVSRPFVGRDTETRTATLSVDGATLARAPLCDRYPRSLQLRLTPERWTGTRLTLTFDIEPASPADQGLSDDSRQLGVYLEALTVRAERAA
jgi:hypothetical protein